ncbi:MAG: class I tRNA ligase family protein, partial [Beduini sp.]
LGNGVDPMDVIDQYGADALRFYLTTNSAPGMDLRYVPEKMEATWNFINKIWNAARFVLMNTPEDLEYQDITLENLNIADQWILSRLNSVIKVVDEQMDKYEFVNVGSELYKFIWDDFCSWYIELSKVSLNSENAQEKTATVHTLVYVLNAIVKLLHPFMPFVTEEIYQSIPHAKESICIEEWPVINDAFNLAKVEEEVAYLIDIVTGIREIRANYTIKNANEIHYMIISSDDQLAKRLEAYAPFVKKLCNAISDGTSGEVASKDVATATIKGGNIIQVSLVGLINLEEEKQKLEKELNKLTGEIKRCEGMLANPNFVAKAPAAKIEAEKEKLEDYRKKYEAVNEQLKQMTQG